MERAKEFIGIAIEVHPSDPELFRLRQSSELPDDEGYVFVTDVPGAWFQVSGRRAYGELWYRCALVHPKGKRSPAESLPAGWALIERGPVAENLIAIVDYMHGDEILSNPLANGIVPAFVRPSIRARAH